jgi:aryl-alcohol dehydrogenase-like predicted oxidoreductase
MAAVAAGTGTMIIGNTINAVPSASPPSMFDPLQSVTLGKTGIKTTLLGMGTGVNGYNHSSSITRAGTAESLIRAAYDRGIRFFDCADGYGTHSFASAALKSIPRENYVLCTKMSVMTRPAVDNDDAAMIVDRFRKEMKTDYIDVLQLHCLMTGDWPEKQKRVMDGLEKLKAKNIIRAHGLSVHSLEALKTASENPWADVIHVRINHLGENMDDRDVNVVVPIVEKIHRSGKGVIGMKLIGEGKFKNEPEKIDEAVRFVLKLGTVDTIIVGFELPEQIDNYIERIKKVQKS